MSRFAIRTPYFIVVTCLIIAILGAVSISRMPVDMFPAINIPVVVVATFYSGMPPEQVEKNITERQERFFTLAPGIEHIESRSLTGASIIKIFFQPGANASSASQSSPPAVPAAPALPTPSTTDAAVHRSAPAHMVTIRSTREPARWSILAYRHQRPLAPVRLRVS